MHDKTFFLYIVWRSLHVNWLVSSSKRSKSLLLHSCLNLSPASPAAWWRVWVVPSVSTATCFTPEWLRSQDTRETYSHIGVHVSPSSMYLPFCTCKSWSSSPYLPLAVCVGRAATSAYSLISRPPLFLVVRSLVLLWTQMEGRNGGGWGTRLISLHVLITT